MCPLYGEQVANKKPPGGNFEVSIAADLPYGMSLHVAIFLHNMMAIMVIKRKIVFFSSFSSNSCPYILLPMPTSCQILKESVNICNL
jgi:hypothetical protein